jgi:hypothetical protein
MVANFLSPPQRVWWRERVPAAGAKSGQVKRACRVPGGMQRVRAAYSTTSVDAVMFHVGWMDGWPWLASGHFSLENGLMDGRTECSVRSERLASVE